MPKITFVIPAYNSAHFICPAVKSCLDQTEKDVEVLVVDDHSEDSLDRRLKAFDDHRLRVVKNLGDRGRSAARNLGNSEAKSDVICVLDADDLSKPSRASLTWDAYQEQEYKHNFFSHGGADSIDEIDRVVAQYQGEEFNLSKARDNMTNGIVHSTVAYSKDLALRYPYKDGEISELGIDDWNQQVRIARDGHSFTFIPKRISSYRTGVGVSVTRDEGAVKKVKEEYFSRETINA